MRPHLPHDLLGKHRDLAGEQGADAEWRGGVGDAGFPVTCIGPQLVQRVVSVAFQFGDPRLGLFAIPGGEDANQVGLRGKMMVNARFADADHLGDVGITEAVIAAGDDQAARARCRMSSAVVEAFAISLSTF